MSEEASLIAFFYAAAAFNLAKGRAAKINKVIRSSGRR